MKRRHVLAWLGGLGVTTVATDSRTVEGYLRALNPAARDSHRERALKAVRFLNTLLAAHHAKAGTYTDLIGLRSSPAITRFESSAYASLLRAGKIADLAPGFAIILILGPENRGYDLVVAQLGATFKYATDETGTIHTVTNGDGGSATTAPLEDEPGSGGGFMKAVLAVAGFFVPVLSASDNPCGSCFTCQPSCGACSAELGGCCNWGTQACTWCCKTWMGCLCPE